MSFVVTGYYPGALGAITESHARYYNRYWGFDRTFEIEVAVERRRSAAGTGFAGSTCGLSRG